ncbi:hypothetical protein RSAG8_05581, partial [Rhizoctonia solani AG-8 WAC10335]
MTRLHVRPATSAERHVANSSHVSIRSHPNIRISRSTLPRAQVTSRPGLRILIGRRDAIFR